MNDYVVEYIESNHFDTIKIRRKAESIEDLLEKLKDLFIVSIMKVEFELDLNAIYKGEN